MRIAIIGGGGAGLALSYYLSKLQHKVFLFEKEKTLGGLAGYFAYNNLYIDKYYHFICAEDKHYVDLLKELLLVNKIKSKITKMGYFYNDKIYSLSTPFELLKFSPLNLYHRLRYLFALLYIRLKKDWRGLDKINATFFLKKISGEKIYNIIWDPVLKGKFGEYYKDISAAWILKRLKRVATSRSHFGIYEKMRYLEGGTKTIITEIEKNILKNNGVIFKNFKVQKIIVNNNFATSVIGPETFSNFDKIICCIPIPAFLNVISQTDDNYIQLLKKIKYIGVLCGVLILKKKFTEYFWLNINSEDIPFVNLVEYSNLDTEKGKNIIYIPEYLDTNTDRFNKSDDELKSEYIKYLKKINNNFSENDIEGFFLFRDEFAQPICGVSFSDLNLGYKTHIENLYLLESSLLYPDDRTLSGSIKLAKELSKKL